MASWHPTSKRTFSNYNTGTSLLCRIKPGAATINRVHLYQSSSFPYGSKLGIEILTSITPQELLLATSVPGTDVLSTGWTSTAGSFFSVLDETAGTVDTSNYATNAYINQGLRLGLRGANSASYGRVSAVTVNIVAQTTEVATAGAIGEINLSGTWYQAQSYSSNSYALGDVTSGDLAVRTARFDYNPATSAPWTSTQVQGFANTAGTDEFGLSTYVSNGDVLVYAIWLDIEYVATDTRLCSGYFLIGSSFAGWKRYDLSVSAVASANTYYWLHVYTLSGFIAMPVLRDDGAVFREAIIATNTTDEHRKAYTGTVLASGVLTGSSSTQGEIFPFLLDATGTIQAQSQPYAGYAEQPIYTGVGHYGQQITTAAATTYSGVRLSVGWQNTTVRPTAALTLQLRSGGGSLTGGGTLHATATLGVDDLATGAMQDVQVAFASAFAAAATTQYVIYVTTTAADGFGWKIAYLSTLSTGVLITTTVANLDGAGQNGTTDDYDFAGTATDRMDAPICIYAFPATPTGLSVSITTYDPNGYVNITWTSSPASNFQKWLVYRKAAAETVYTKLGEILVSGTKVWHDWLAGTGDSYTYQLTQADIIGESAPVTSGSVSPVSSKWWLTYLGDETKNLQLHVVSNDFTDEWENATFHLIGRGRKKDFGTHLGVKGSLTAHMFEGFDGLSARAARLKIKALRDLLSDLNLRTPFGDVYLVDPGNLSVSHTPGGGPFELATVSLEYEELDAAV